MCNMNLDEHDWHKKEAMRCFNGTWDLLDKKDRTPLENNQMIHMAHASRFHWEHVGGPVEFARGEWQVSRVYSVLSKAESAIYHANASLMYCRDHGIGSFDLAFAYEAMARAYEVAKDLEQMNHYLDLANQSASAIESEEDRSYFLSELSGVGSFNTPETPE